MPSSALTILDSQIFAEYDRRCWTATAKQAKYVKLYALLQEATRTIRTHNDATMIKQALYRALMARSEEQRTYDHCSDIDDLRDTDDKPNRSTFLCSLSFLPFFLSLSLPLAQCVSHEAFLSCERCFARS